MHAWKAVDLNPVTTMESRVPDAETPGPAQVLKWLFPQAKVRKIAIQLLAEAIQVAHAQRETGENTHHRTRIPDAPRRCVWFWSRGSDQP